MTARRRPRARAYYNEWEAYPAEWLRRLMQAGLIMKGVVNEQDIQKVRPSSLAGYERCHFFAGIGGWELALQLAGWPEGSEVWTGSCPCQPFSLAGKRKGTQDVKHVWPVWRARIARYLPPVIFGEQVTSPLGREWLAGVRADLEALGYEVGAADLCAASAGAPHIRQRLWWVADARRPSDECGLRPREASSETQAPEGEMEKRERGGVNPRGGGCARGMGEPNCRGREQGQQTGEAMGQGDSTLSAGSNGFWSDFELIPCGDEKARRIEPGTFPLAHGVSNRAGKLRSYGNAIVPQVAAEFIAAYMEVRNIGQTDREEKE